MQKLDTLLGEREIDDDAAGGGNERGHHHDRAVHGSRDLPAYAEHSTRHGVLAGPVAFVPAAHVDCEVDP
jgi:hypothetical protein